MDPRPVTNLLPCNDFVVMISLSFVLLNYFYVEYFAEFNMIELNNDCIAMTTSHKKNATTNTKVEWR